MLCLYGSTNNYSSYIHSYFVLTYILKFNISKKEHINLYTTIFYTLYINTTHFQMRTIHMSSTQSLFNIPAGISLSNNFRYCWSHSWSRSWIRIFRRIYRIVIYFGKFWFRSSNWCMDSIVITISSI